MKEAAIESKKGGERGLTPQSVKKATPVGNNDTLNRAIQVANDALGCPRKVQRLTGRECAIEISRERTVVYLSTTEYYEAPGVYITPRQARSRLPLRCVGAAVLLLFRIQVLLPSHGGRRRSYPRHANHFQAH